MDHNDSPYSQGFRKHHFGFVVTFLTKGYSHCINFILRTFFLKVKCTPHDKIAKDLKEQNDGIYRTVMVSILLKIFPVYAFSSNQFEQIVIM